MLDLNYEWVEVNCGFFWRVFAKSREWRNVPETATKIERVGSQYVASFLSETHAAPSFRQARLWAEARQAEMLAKFEALSKSTIKSITVNCYDCGAEMPLGPVLRPVPHLNKRVLKCPMCHPDSGLEIADSRTEGDGFNATNS